MPHPEREHSLQIEVARLQRERDEALSREARLAAANKALAGDVTRCSGIESERDALRTALEEVNDLLMSVPPGEDWRALVREKVVTALHGEAAWEEK